MSRTPTAANMNQSWQTSATLAAARAPFLRRLLEDWPQLPEELQKSGADATFRKRMNRLKRARSKLDDRDGIARLLRKTRGEVALIVALADLSGAWDIDVAAASLTRFAEAAADLALRTALAPLFARDAFNRRDYDSCGFTCLGLGKLGAGELNYSSDIDLIFLFDEQHLTTSDGDDPLDLLLRAVRTFTDLLHSRTEDGYVLRVDLRLRPDPNATAAVLSMAAAEGYYQSAALTWERAAFTRARAIAGDIGAGEAFLGRLSSWIWRRSLDFTAIRDIHDLRLHMADHYGQEEFRAAGYDLKRGPGGIREVEFVLQMHQLIHGGRLPALRRSNTLNGLSALADCGLLPAEDVRCLQKNYRWLRRAEHRLQMMEDAQTHTVPEDVLHRSDLAQLCNYQTCEAFDADLISCCAEVHLIYDRLTESKAGNGAHLPREDERLEQHLSGLGFGLQAGPMVQVWRTGRFRALRTPRAQAALEGLMPDFLAVLAKSPEPDVLLARVNDMLERLPSGVQFLELLDANRKLLDLLARVLMHSPALATQLAQHPSLLDAVFDSSFFKLPESATALRLELAALLGSELDETQIDKVARWQAEKKFQLAVLVIDGLADGRAAARALAWVMDAVVDAVASIGASHFERTQGTVKGGRLVLLALGGWGGEALMSTSDLDLVCLFTGTHDAKASGKSDLTATQYFNRLAQRVIGYLTAHTSYGPMAEIDMRLRPSGNQGLLCVNIESFADYQRSQAWTWEHLALTRARCVHGPGTAAMAAAMTALRAKRDVGKLVADTLEMRGDITTHKPPEGPFDLKLMPGGIIDIEFITHVLQLKSATRHARVIQPSIDAALSELCLVGALEADAGRQLNDIYQRFIAARMVLALCADGDETAAPLPNVQQPMLARALGCADPGDVQQQIAVFAQQVQDHWTRLFTVRKGKST